MPHLSGGVTFRRRATRSQSTGHHACASPTSGKARPGVCSGQLPAAAAGARGATKPYRRGCAAPRSACGDGAAPRPPRAPRQVRWQAPKPVKRRTRPSAIARHRPQLQPRHGRKSDTASKMKGNQAGRPPARLATVSRPPKSPVRHTGFSTGCYCPARLRPPAKHRKMRASRL